jgi:hypothetical protein
MFSLPFSRCSRQHPLLRVAAIAMSMMLAPSARAQDHDMAHMDHETEADTSAKRPMEVASPLGIPMERTGSGTSWLPDAAPMRAIHARAGDWTFMTHGVVFGMYDKQNGPRGVDHLASLHWAMLMATRQTARSKLQFRSRRSCTTGRTRPTSPSGVLTAGVFTRSLRLEASIFNGREPDETRTDFDYEGRSLDSYAARLTWNPTANWSLSGSWAYLESPDAAVPDESMRRAHSRS